MRAMLLAAAGESLRPAQLPIPSPGRGQLLLKVLACGVCRTDLHIADGELAKPKPCSYSAMRLWVSLKRSARRRR
jgi:propanol-preferring alcohol dehydrogenase